ncbi:MAG TPA: hypothetical protein VGK79_05495 [Gaiellaceae bacterium]
MKRAAVLLAVAALAGCGGRAAPPPDHATLTDIRVRPDRVEFEFDSDVQHVSAAPAPGPFAECGSGAAVKPAGAEFVVVRFSPAQTRDIPKRIIRPSGPILDVWKTCDFEADVSWVIGLDRQAAADVSRDGSTVTVTFGG